MSDAKSNLSILPIIKVKNSTISIEYEVKSRLSMDIKLYDIAGRLIRTLYSGIAELDNNEF